MEGQSCSSGSNCQIKSNANLSWIPAIIVMLLPKCPLCIMAYGGAITLCSGATVVPEASISDDRLYLLIGSSIVVLIGLLLNYRGLRTKVAVAVSCIAITLLIISQLYWINSTLMHMSMALLLIGVWINGSFLYILNYLNTTFTKYILKPVIKK